MEVENRKTTAAEMVVDEAQTEDDGQMLATGKAVDSTEDDDLENEDEGQKEEEVRHGRLWCGSYYLDVCHR